MRKINKYGRFDCVTLEDAPRYSVRVAGGIEKNINLFPETINEKKALDIVRESSVSFWNTVFSYYSFSSLKREFRFYRFFELIDRKILKDILTAQNISETRYREIKEVSLLPAEYSALFEEGIAPQYVQILYLHNQNFLNTPDEKELSKKFMQLLMIGEVNKNSKKELINLWVDMGLSAKKELIEISEALQNKLKIRRKNLRISDKLLKEARKLRFPVYSKIDSEYKETLSKIKKKKGLKIDSSIAYEKDHLFLNVELTAAEDIDEICRYLNDNKEKIKELFELSKKYDNNIT